MHPPGARDRLRPAGQNARNATMPDWRSDLVGINALVLGVMVNACRNDFAEACAAFALDNMTAKALAEMDPQAMKRLMDEVGPTQLIQLRDSPGLRSMVAWARAEEPRPADQTLADRMAHTLKT